MMDKAWSEVKEMIEKGGFASKMKIGRMYSALKIREDQQNKESEYLINEDEGIEKIITPDLAIAYRWKSGEIEYYKPVYKNMRYNKYYPTIEAAIIAGIAELNNCGNMSDACMKLLGLYDGLE